MSEFSSRASAPPVPPWVPSREEDRRRIAFQMLHPEVGFTYRARPEPAHWLGYWWDAGQGRPRHETAATLGELVEKIAAGFADT